MAVAVLVAAAVAVAVAVVSFRALAPVEGLESRHDVCAMTIKSTGDVCTKETGDTWGWEARSRRCVRYDSTCDDGGEGNRFTSAKECRAATARCKAKVRAATKAPAVPSWAKPVGLGSQYKWVYAGNRKILEDAGEEPFDLLVYGDSITYYHHWVNRTVWDRHFGGMKAEALGMPGGTVEDLMWRLANGEAPRVAPRAIAIMIGTNNSPAKTSPALLATRLGVVLKWLRATYPDTRILLLPVLPESKGKGYAQKNAAFKQVAAGLGVPMASCGMGMRPTDASVLPDGLHPNEAGYEIVLSCLARALGVPA